ncbi:formamidopyrimidine-DNA glycosylase [Moorella thermoacetica]|uniref:Formamidopyrimidine-DNA glycosylase n=1 Tax=Moorella thermoacetica (strain ATCC 39073 / JCM 9320) TaxID=264732 RepID=FPG_MOOTA|nr:bifunctional DNA-formamidopyrimidine glycosylase/DNA-(apurinic or apyrimidinic site) lyase [Moorella thermoacetica]Q2RHE9.1 RecName: Full=Formamidopyrimidine-DNA glycosylase; Short=Fapy-DNA glycosylase; AltName: Full=DNA-(apurinic or apyrimidinic site) lyase MutM; Short=AP lyase MutM [Moorella thermoacetica ATCC 39073]AKX94654.1 formamidopyrimidine-DNA glycosylase [Moorella thermoacetica]AKX97287.1 formamidopyrimidine-DNA glycosylase [Moorella thermoacetica]OIQ57294.1 formamidopyrimidine-DNA
MPELPEVETIKRTLTPCLREQKIARVEVYHPGVIAAPDPETFSRLLAGRIITGLDRRGKYLLVHLSGEYCLVVHLRMTGRLVFTEGAAPLAPHTHVVFSLAGGPSLRFVDTRRFGRLYLAAKAEVETLPGLRDLGPEPLDPAFDALALAAILAGRRRPIKQVLLDQRLVAGIGNIYADEMLFAAGIDPRRPAASLNHEEVARLRGAMQRVLEQGIANRGTSIRDYVDGSGRQGSNQEHLQVYGRTGRPCPRCGQPLERVRLGGRSTHFCPRCQV